MSEQSKIANLKSKILMEGIIPRPYLLENKIQHYLWGTRGEDAFIPHLLGIGAEPGCPYAELWMGTHDNAPSGVIIENSVILLSQLIFQYPLEIPGKAIHEKFSGKLPFLFKVLSIAEALSIQVHPDKEQAEYLHAKDPEHYPDSNHKPELAIALDSLTALVGFKSFPEILDVLEKYPEITGFIGQEVCGKLKDPQSYSSSEQSELLRLIYSTMVKRSKTHEAELTEAINKLYKRLSKYTNDLREEERIFFFRGTGSGNIWRQIGLF